MILDETNILDCYYDGGDCCGNNVTTDRCSECTCNLQEACANGFMSSSIGDGFCNDETNNNYCNYDHGDCCLSDLNSDYCLECLCSANGIITSPGFPQNYDINMDWTWLIQVSLGQYIRIDFQSFDLQDHTSCM